MSSGIPALLTASVALVLLLGACAGESRDVSPGVAGRRAGTPAAAPEAAPAAPAPAPGPAVAARLPASDVLRSWDAARARAFADGDAAALRRLYLAGSLAGTADVRLLRAYGRRGLRVEGLHMQLLALDVLRDEPGLLRLRVTDRVAGAVAVGRGSRTPLPRDTATTRVLELRRPGARWRVAWVRE